MRRWLKGYSWKYQDGRNRSGPLWTLQYADDDELGGEQVLAFDDLLELRTVARFIEQGVSLRALRATIEAASEEFGPRPLHKRRFLTDGRRFFYEALELSGEHSLIDFKGRQKVLGVPGPSGNMASDYLRRCGR